MDDTIQINPYNKKYHHDDFREQIGLLYFCGYQDNLIKLIRSFIGVCTPGSASFDIDNPGEDTLEGWEFLDEQLESDMVVGTFHTHPRLITRFSSQDIVTQIGLAKTYGSKLLWHGVQAANWNDTQFTCTHMICGSIIMRYDYGFISSNLDDPVILLPLPPMISVCDGILSMSIGANNG